jgi:hypothetical protein
MSLPAADARHVALASLAAHDLLQASGHLRGDDASPHTRNLKKSRSPAFHAALSRPQASA